MYCYVVPIRCLCVFRDCLCFTLDVANIPTVWYFLCYMLFIKLNIDYIGHAIHNVIID